MTIRFSTNVAVELRMRSLDGKPVESQFGGMQHMFSAEEGAFYVSETVGGMLMDQFRKLNVKPGEPIEITKAEVNKGNGRKGIQWTVSKVGFAVGERGDGTFAVSTPQPPSELEQQLAASLAMVEARKQAQRAAAAAPVEQPKWALHLAAQTKHLVDVYAELVSYAAKHGNTVRADDVRAMMTTVYIGLTKNSGGSNSNAA
jgi:hypothetical protein